MWRSWRDSKERETICRSCEHEVENNRLGLGTEIVDHTKFTESIDAVNKMLSKHPEVDLQNDREAESGQVVHAWTLSFPWRGGEWREGASLGSKFVTLRFFDCADKIVVKWLLTSEHSLCWLLVSAPNAKPGLRASPRVSDACSC